MKGRHLRVYMVGFHSDRQAIYGKDEQGKARYADAMTLAQATRKLKELRASNRSKAVGAIYELVPVRLAKIGPDGEK